MGEKFTFFWSGPFSNWAKSDFVYKNKKFSSSEQALMWEKAMMFGDEANAQKILETRDPSRQKFIGRLIEGYVDEQWAAARLEIVTEILRHKFRQSTGMYDALMETSGTTLVGASPLDKIWGIGLAAENPDCLNRDTWQGLNLLGIALTTVRTELENERG